MLRIQIGLIKLLGILLLSFILSNFILIGLNIIMIVMVLMPFYGLYRAKKGQDVTKGLRHYLQPLLYIIGKLFKVKYFGLAGLLIIGIITISVVEGLGYMFLYTIVVFIVTSIAWGAIRYVLKRFKNIDIPNFLQVIRLAF